MKLRSILSLRKCGSISCWLGLVCSLTAQEAPRFTGIQRLTNNEVLLKLSSPTGLNYRIDASTDLPSWLPLVTLPPSSGSVQHTDSAAPFLGSRYYRALQLDGTNILTGDHLATTNGDVIFHPVGHASLVMSWNGIMIYNDPTNGAAPYASFPRADLILVSHEHGDHFSNTTLDAVKGSNTVIIAPQRVYDLMTASLKALTRVMTNGATLDVMGLTIEAVRAYNSNHPLGYGNGYILTIGGKRIYMSGDTGNIPEMRALPGIDVAFLCMNVPFTMTVNEATNAVRAFRPKVVYPYHYRDQSGAITNATSFKQLLGTDPGVEVRLRKWY